MTIWGKIPNLRFDAGDINSFLVSGPNILKMFKLNEGEGQETWSYLSRTESTRYLHLCMVFGCLRFAFFIGNGRELCSGAIQDK